MISVIIPVLNEEDKIRHCLRAVFNQTIKPLEVIIVDGHSTDRTIEFAKEFPARILYEEYHTRAGACQIGVNSSKGDFIAFTDADCIPEKNWLEKLQKEFEDNVSGVGGGIINIGEGTWEKSINLISGTFLGSANSVQGRFFKDKRYVKSISGCNCLYKKSHILEAGGFDTKLSTAEDTELNRKILKIGKLIFTPSAIVLHNHKRGLEKYAKRMHQYGYGRAKARLLDLQVLPPIFVPLLLLSLIFESRFFWGMIEIYIIMLLVMATKFAVHERSPVYLISIPAVYIIEHCSYTMGFWMGLLSDITRSLNSRNSQLNS